MPSKDASAQKANREKAKAEKEERRRLGRERAANSKLRRSGFLETSQEVENSGEVETQVEDQLVIDIPEAKHKVNDLVCFEDTRVGEPSKVFWESLAVVKSRRCHDSQWLCHLDDLDYDRAYVYNDAPERRIMDSRLSS